MVSFISQQTVLSLCTGWLSQFQKNFLLCFNEIDHCYERKINFYNNLSTLNRLRWIKQIKAKIAETFFYQTSAKIFKNGSNFTEFSLNSMRHLYFCWMILPNRNHKIWFYGLSFSWYLSRCFTEFNLDSVQSLLPALSQLLFTEAKPL